MKTIKYILIVIAGLTSWMMIGISGLMMKTDAPLVTDDYIYATMLILSVIYLHWVLRTYLIPLNKLSQDQAKWIRNETNNKYTKGLFAGSIGAGYILLAFHVIAFLDRNVAGKPSFLSLALFLITLGTFAQARAVIEKLCEISTKIEKQ